MAGARAPDDLRPWRQAAAGDACRGYDTWLPLRLVGGIGGGHPDARDLSHAHVFARDLVESVQRA